MKNKINLVLVNLWAISAKTPHFGLISLAAFVREKHPNLIISIVEGTDIFEKIINKKPDIVGFTSDTLTFTRNVKLAMRLNEKINAPFIIGGVHITAMPESLDPVFQLGVIGEGELTFSELLSIFEKYKAFPKEELRNTDGIVYHENRKIIITNNRKLIENIDSLPYPARDLTPMEERYLKNQLNLFGVKRLATIMTSRGCPYKCIFCGSPVQWGVVRFHSAEYVVNEIEFLLENYKIDGIMFWDDLFIAPQNRLMKMVELIKSKGLDKKLVFFGYARANLINDEICSALRSINVKRLIFGLETGSDRILSYLKRSSVKVIDNQRAVELCRKYGITTSSGFIVGTPGETVDDLRMTYEFMKNYPLDNTQIYILTPYPGTEIWKSAEKEGLISSKMDFDQLFVQLPSPSIFDIFRESNLDILRGRIFLNNISNINKEYTDLIFKMNKLSYWQNFKFYLKVVPKDLSLIIRVLVVKLRGEII